MHFTNKYHLIIIQHNIKQALENAAFRMSCVCNKMDALLSGDEVTDDDN